ncbi:flagellar hook-associated protein FlgK [Peribacillus glennii]|uniref:Flagellar hook-associated protein 1 n=1 Tax=Peribacillus glennii TaxID=2303991 RepID=A0A372LF64_9BACI|nr:flagellar hook-associated protein FlgK [Peribacillus glennii]RFU63950.1 flagellar hook-associated protein FlgK [Peribacillus glennii]
MRSTFMGLETARRGMFTQQGALYTTGHNVANANTPGYTRQRVNFVQTEPYPGIGMNSPMLPGQMGTGVKAGSVQRVRESFLDVQYRSENNKLGYWETRAESYEKIEEIMNEPSDSGLAKTMDMFWQSLQDLAVNAKNPGARSVVRQRGVGVSETFNYLADALKGVRQDIKNEIMVAEKEINSLTEQINKVNAQISDVEPHGYLPNDLYDERDRLIDQLSSLVNIKVDYVKNSGNSSEIAEGKAIISMVNDNGTTIGQLVGINASVPIKVNFDGTDGSVKTFDVGTTNFGFKGLGSQGKLQALIESYGYVSDTQEVDGVTIDKVTGIYSDMLSELDNMAYTFAIKFNDQHKAGVTPNQMNQRTTDPTPPFFADSGNSQITLGNKTGFASRIKVDNSIMESLDNIASASVSNPTMGDAANVLALAEVINTPYVYGNQMNSNLRNYYEVIVGGMAVDSQEAVRLSSNSGVLRQAVEDRRMSMSSVSLDEEMSNMIQFQHAYNASARMITLQDELLDKIINGMGTVGR